MKNTRVGGHVNELYACAGLIQTNFASSWRGSSSSAGSDHVRASGRRDAARDPDTGDALVNLVSAVDRIVAAVLGGLGRLFAACLTDSDSEWARVARDAKLIPMADGLTARLEKVRVSRPDMRRRAETAMAYLLWKTAIGDQSAGIRDDMLALMGVTASPERDGQPPSSLIT